MKYYNRKSIESKNFKRVQRSTLCTTLYETIFRVLYFQINRFQFNDLVTYISSVFYFVSHIFCFLAAVDCKRYRVRFHNDAHFLLLVNFLFPMINDIFICILQLGDKVGVFYEQDNFDLHVIDITVSSMYLSNYLWKCNLTYR